MIQPRRRGKDIERCDCLERKAFVDADRKKQQVPRIQSAAMEFAMSLEKVMEPFLHYYDRQARVAWDSNCRWPLQRNSHQRVLYMCCKTWADREKLGQYVLYLRRLP